jgi:hypothetical protein
MMSYLQLTFSISSIFSNSVLTLLLTMALFIIWRFAKTVEDFGFKKRIPVSELKVGDVLLESKVWEGLTNEGLNKIKKSGKKFVVIKEGVRFAMAFPLALVFTLFYGDGLLFLFRFLF